MVLNPVRSPLGMAQIPQALLCSTLPLISLALCLLTALFSLCLLSLFFRVCVLSASLCMALKSTRAHGWSIPLPTPSDHLLQLHLEFRVLASSLDL